MNDPIKQAEVNGYENYVGAIVVNQCPVNPDHSHFLREDEENHDQFTPTETGGTYHCPLDRDVEIVVTVK